MVRVCIRIVADVFLVFLFVIISVASLFLLPLFVTKETGDLQYTEIRLTLRYPLSSACVTHNKKKKSKHTYSLLIFISLNQLI